MYIGFIKRSTGTEDCCKYQLYLFQNIFGKMSNEYLNISSSLTSLKLGSSKQLYRPVLKKADTCVENDVNVSKTEESCDQYVKKFDYTQQHGYSTEGKAEWFILGVVFLSNVLLGWTFICFSVLYVYFVEHYDSNKATCGWIGSVQMGVAQTFGLPVSPLLIIYGCRPVSMVGSLIVTASIAASAFAPYLWFLFLTFGIFSGMGLSMMYLCNAVIIQQRFHKNRALAGGFALCGLSVGNSMGPVVEYLEELYGWKGALLIHAGIMAHGLVLSALLHPPWLSYSQVVQKYGQNKTDASAPLQETVTSFLSHLCDFSVLKCRPFSLFCLAYLFMMIYNNAFWNHLSGRAIFYGLSYTQGPVLLTVLGVCTLVSRAIFSFISNFNCVNKLLLFSLGTCCGGLFSILLTFCYSFPMMAAVTAMFGTHLGCTVTVVSVCGVLLVGRDHIARAQGFLNFAYGIAAVTATPLSGWIFDSSNDYNLPFYVTGTIGLVGSVLSFLSFLETCKTSSTSKLDNS